MKKLLKFISFIIILPMLFLAAPAVYAQQADFGLDEYDYHLPQSVIDELDQNGVTPESVSPDTLSVQSILSYILGLFTGSLDAPIKLTVSLLTVILLAALANVMSDTAGGARQVFSLVSVLASAAMTLSPVSSAIASSAEVIKGGSAFLQGFIPAFAGMLAMSGQVTAAAAINTLVMAGAQLFSILSANIIMPASSCIMGLTLAGAADPDLKLATLADGAKKVIIWGLGLIMTVFVAVLGLQSFITLPADGIAIKTARFTVANSVPFIGGTVSDALSVMQGGINMIRNNFGSFGIIAGAVLMLPTLTQVVLYRLSLTVCAAAGDMFGLSALTGLLKGAESVMSIILAVLVCFMLILVISISLMIFVGMGAVV